MPEKLEGVTPPQEGKETPKPHENIYMHEWMAKEMIDEIKEQGHNPEDVSFSAGFDKTSDASGEPIRNPFFTINFRDEKEWFKAYWNPETKGSTLKIEYSGEAIDEKEK